MLATKMNIDMAVQEAQRWTEYEGVLKVVPTEDQRAIVVLTSCNPAAITAPIPSFFQGFSVIFCELSEFTQQLES